MNAVKLAEVGESRHTHPHNKVLVLEARAVGVPGGVANFGGREGPVGRLEGAGKGERQVAAGRRVVELGVNVARPRNPRALLEDRRAAQCWNKAEGVYASNVRSKQCAQSFRTVKHAVGDKSTGRVRRSAGTCQRVTRLSGCKSAVQLNVVA